MASPEAEARTWGVAPAASAAAPAASALAPWLAAALVVAALAAVTAPALAQSTGSFGRRGDIRYKPFSGFRVRSDSSRQVYFHEQTIAVVELGAGRHLINCELIEVLTPELEKAALKNLSAINKPIPISFKQMMDLMYQCKDFEGQGGSTRRAFDAPSNARINPLTVLTGILPGTKWCGNGDLATNYYDLGYLSNVDKCCRAHDICPVKVRGFQARYDLMNYSFYTKSHCACDAVFYDCLKQTKHPTANLMGTIYFNLLRVQCLQEEEKKCKTRDCKTPESRTKRRFQNPLRVF